eukprot:Sdes_comp9610_c0_seq1m1094
MLSNFVPHISRIDGNSSQFTRDEANKFMNLDMRQNYFDLLIKKQAHCFQLIQKDSFSSLNSLLGFHFPTPFHLGDFAADVIENWETSRVDVIFPSREAREKRRKELKLFIHRLTQLTNVDTLTLLISVYWIHLLHLQ